MPAYNINNLMYLYILYSNILEALNGDSGTESSIYSCDLSSIH